jgi:hypothetical protein
LSLRENENEMLGILMLFLMSVMMMMMMMMHVLIDSLILYALLQDTRYFILRGRAMK